MAAFADWWKSTLEGMWEWLRPTVAPTIVVGVQPRTRDATVRPLSASSTVLPCTADATVRPLTKVKA